MNVLIFSAPAIIGFFGGMVILSRSGTRYGRTMAAGLLFLSCTEICYAIFSLTGTVSILRAAAFFELSSSASILLSVSSMEKRLAKNAGLIRGLRLFLILTCALFGFLAALVPESAFSVFADETIRLGWVMQVQAMLVLACAIAFMWIMENIIRSSTEDQRRILKYPALGIIALGVSFVIMAVKRLSTLSSSEDMLVLYSLIFLVGIIFVVFFSIRFKLFEMDIFVSRYVVYHSATFLIIGAYLLGMGLVIMGIRRMGIEISFVATGFFVFLVLFALAVFILSKDAKARLRFFINTHFFANKYDYRKEWGELSGYLSIAFNEKQIIHVTAQVILDSMYISELAVWVRDGASFRCGYAFPSRGRDSLISADEPLVKYLEENPYFLRKTPRLPDDPLWEKIVKDHGAFLDGNRIELAAPMMVENRLIGFIAVGTENPGTPYGRDDIDLLTAVASQSSAALTSARFAQELAANKELDTFNRMSSYVLHDLKNAAGNLSLILQNAPNHMDNEEFRTDMLDTISQTLGRIDKVMSRLGAMPDKGQIVKETVAVEPFIERVVSKLAPRLGGITLTKDIHPGLEFRTDPGMLERIIENLVINATEAAPEDGHIIIRAEKTGPVFTVSIEDNGTGMTDEFIRKRLFKPFQTTKKNGTGLGLWQVKNMIDQLGATIELDNRIGEGLRVVIGFPG